MRCIWATATPWVRGERYDQLIDAYVTAAGTLFPHAMLHWEDFGADNARRVLTRYADSCASFNDDLHGTAAVVLAAVFSALTVSGTRMRDQRIVITVPAQRQDRTPLPATRSGQPDRARIGAGRTQRLAGHRLADPPTGHP